MDKEPKENDERLKPLNKKGFSPNDFIPEGNEPMEIEIFKNGKWVSEDD